MTSVYPLKCLIRAQAEATRVDVYDDIGDYGWFGGITAQEFAAQVAGIKGAIEVHINSGGGDVFDGIAIGNAIRAHQGDVTTVNDGIAASIASVIFQAGKKRIAQAGSMVMIHDAFGGCMGDAAEMTKTAEILNKVSDNIASIYASRAGGSPESWRAEMLTEKWYTAEEAVEAGLADEVGSGTAELPPGLDVAAFTAVPGRIAARLRSMPVAKIPHAGEPKAGDRPAAAEQSCEALGHQCCKDAASAKDMLRGLIRDEISAKGDAAAALVAAGEDPAEALKAAGLRAAQGKDMHGDHERVDPDGDGDCDACPEGDTDHDYWSPDGEQKKDLPGKPKPAEDRALTADDIRALVREELAAFRNAGDDVDNSDWDASKAWHNGAESDDPAAFYAGICAGKKAGDKSTQDAWALPYKYAPSKPPNAAGVKNALARLPQTEGLTNEAEAKATLRAAMKKVNPDYEPEDHASAELTDEGYQQVLTALEGAGI